MHTLDIIVVVVELNTGSLETAVVKKELVDCAEFDVVVNSELVVESVETTVGGEVVECVELKVGVRVLMIVTAIEELFLNSDSIL